jgi:hypothetical protein
MAAFIPPQATRLALCQIVEMALAGVLERLDRGWIAPQDDVRSADKAVIHVAASMFVREPDFLRMAETSGAVQEQP